MFKKTLLTLFAMAIFCSVVNGAESSCPADRAAQRGFDPFGEFHHLLAPVWHQSWPAKDYDALIAAGPQFATSFEKIAAMKPEFASTDRMEKFNQYRKEFADLVEKFALAASNKDKDAVYEIMPDLHDAFEMTASTLLAIHYPELEGVIITFNLIQGSHLPSDNMDGVIGSTETLVAKMEGLSEKSLPEELEPLKSEVLAQFDIFKDLVTKMKDCCDKKEMDEYRKHVETLSTALDQFVKKYI